MSIQNPPVFEHGFVVGRYVTAIADTLGDDDRYPDLRPITGRVRFTPLQTVHLKGGEYPATVVKQSITVDLDGQGYLADVESLDGRTQPTTPGVYLAVGLYRVEPVFENVSSISRFTIQVTADHTKEAPLDLTLAAPIETPPGFTEVVRIVDRVRAEDAADAAEGHAATALVYRDEAASSATTAQTHSASAGESAEAAEGHADRAEAARDQTISNAVEVDTSAGTKVTVGGVVVLHDTGWRDVLSFLVNGWTASGFQMRRINDMVHVRIFNLRGEDTDTTAFMISPPGFNDGGNGLLFPMADISNSGNARTLRLIGGASGGIRAPASSGTFFTTGYNSGVFPTSISFPTTLPGQPA